MSYSETLCEAVKGFIEADASFKKSDVVVFLEDKFDPATKVAEHATTKLRVMIATSGHARKTGTGASTDGDMSVEVTVFENPARRTGHPERLTVTSASERIAAAVHWKTVTGFKPLRYLDMARADADDHDYRMVVNFAADVALDATASVKWGAGAATIWGEVQRKTVSRGGVTVFEPGSDGNAAFVGTRDRHWRAQLTCAVPATLAETDLPEIGGTFTYGGRTYTCETASLEESGEDTATVTLAGRTVGV